MDASPPAAETKVEVIYSGEAVSDVGGGGDWDYVIIARYPAFENFTQAVTHPAYQGDATAHRPDALENTVMLVCAASPLSEL